jgi:hypothetical protein
LRTLQTEAIDRELRVPRRVAPRIVLAPVRTATAIAADNADSGPPCSSAVIFVSADTDRSSATPAAALTASTPANLKYR